ncbi:hypothetical protein IMZ29_00700 [Achromobacter sp. GG226]|uniref:hypothetical protein n=1 Tax=Verticiella alkaliphila TaxID=2779529 RepID=UPI001C0BC91D|nr:hypothetical protein [Verticiella sp. GG226]MBU4609121.1 hypothetical protein [Verticiella sp. GG226]
MSGWNDAKREVRLAIKAGALLLIAALCLAAYHGSTGAFNFAIVVFVVLAAVVAFAILDIQFSSPHLSLQKRVDMLERENKEIRELAEALLRTQYVFADIGRYPLMDGPSLMHTQLIERYLDPIRRHLNPTLEEDTFRDIAALNLEDEDLDATSQMALIDRFRAVRGLKP